MPTAHSMRTPLRATAQSSTACSATSPSISSARRGRRLRVRGTVNGKVLVYSPRHIVVVDDLRYADDPRAARGERLSRARGRAQRRDRRAGDHGLRRSRDPSVDLRTQPLVVHGATLSRRSGTLNIYGSVAAGSVERHRAALRDQDRVRRPPHDDACARVPDERPLRARFDE